MFDRINLLPEEIKRKRRARKRNFIILLGIVSYIAVIFVTYISLYFLALSASDQLEDVKFKRATLRLKIAQYSLFEKRESELLKRKKSLEQTKEGDISWSSVLYRLSLLLPPQVWLTSFKADSEQINLVGYSLDFKGVAGTVLQLINLKEFEDKVQMKDIKKESIEDSDVLNFDMTVKIKNPTDVKAGTVK